MRSSGKSENVVYIILNGSLSGEIGRKKWRGTRGDA